MTLSTVIFAALVSVGLIVAYAWGYRSGVAYCVRQMQPLGDMAKEIADALKDRRKP
jgi:hypothetical protein